MTFGAGSPPCGGGEAVKGREDIHATDGRPGRGQVLLVEPADLACGPETGDVSQVKSKRSKPNVTCHYRK